MGESGIPTLALVLSILGIVFSSIPCCCMSWIVGLPLNAIALVLAYRALGEIARGVALPEGASRASLARVLAFVGFGINALWLVLFALYFFGVIGLAGIGALLDQTTP